MTIKYFREHPIIRPLSHRLSVFLLAGTMMIFSVSAQYVGFVYPAGGQRGTTFMITLGGQSFQGIDGITVSGSGVHARIIEYNKKMNNQETQLLGEQLRELKNVSPIQPDPVISNLIERIEKLLRENIQTPACASIANLVRVQVTIAPDAEPGQREIRVRTARGISNPLVFYVGQIPEISAPPMITCPLVTLGKEEQSLRKRKREPKSTGSEMMMEGMMMGSAGVQSDLDDEEVCVKIPCVMNGQIAQGSVDRYRFEAKKGQRLVVIVQARELVPFMADAVPGWFQPVLVLCDAKGKEVAYVDDYRFKPDPVMLCEIPEDGEYHLAIYDSIYRGREDFVYRITVGEIPFITSIFPMGARASQTPSIEVKGWNLEETLITPHIKDPVPGIYQITARGKGGLLLSNPMPFALDSLPECMEKEPNSQMKTAQNVTLPVMINGRIDNPGKKDIFQFHGQAGTEIVAEVYARRLNSPLDSILKMTDAAGKILVFNDDREDETAGINTHHADSYIRTKLPTDGTYYIHVNDTQNKSGDDYGYRLRISEPQPDFAIRLVPSMVAIRSNATATLKAFVLRQDGFTNTITFQIKGDTNAFSAMGKISGTQTVAQVTIRTRLTETKEPAVIVIEGLATNGALQWVHQAVPSEDRMQAFLWRHLVPAQELRALVYNPPPPPPPLPKAAKKEEPKDEQKKVNFPQGLMLHFSFDQWESGGVVTDRTGRNNNGRAFGAKWTTTGKQAGGYEFPMTNGYIQVKDSPTLKFKTATFALWFKTSKATSADRTIFEKQKEKGFVLYLEGYSENPSNKGKMCFGVNNHLCRSDGNVVDGTWHHATAVFNGESLKLYLDGQIQKNMTTWNGEIGANTNSLSIGLNRCNPSPHEKNVGFNGIMDEVMIFDHAITDEEVKVVLASTKPKFTKGQVASRLAELKELRERGLLIESFYERRVKECEVTP
jgi:hypothetical protein